MAAIARARRGAIEALFIVRHGRYVSFELLPWRVEHQQRNTGTATHCLVSYRITG